MSNVYFIHVLLIPCLCGALAYNEKQNGNNPSVNQIFQSTNEHLNRIEHYTVHQHNGAIAAYTQFPETFPVHVSSLQNAFYEPANVRPIETTSAQKVESIPYPGSQPFNKPDQVLDHHYLTRPMSVISTPHGTHYLPHIIGSQKPIDFLYDKEHYYLRPEPASALRYDKPRITVLAENIYINNGNPPRYGNKIDSHIGIQNDGKLELLTSKLSLLKRLLTSVFPEKIIVDNKLDIVDLPTFGSKKPQIMPSRLPLMNSLKLENSNVPDVFHHQTIEKETDNTFGFHPLLNPSGSLQQTTGSSNVTDGKMSVGSNEKHENEANKVDISTHINDMDGKHAQSEVFISVDGINKETED